MCVFHRVATGKRLASVMSSSQRSAHETRMLISLDLGSLTLVAELFIINIILNDDLCIYSYYELGDVFYISFYIFLRTDHISERF